MMRGLRDFRLGATALSIAAILACAPAAAAAGDPLRSGSVGLKLSRAFKAQLRQEHVVINGRRFSADSGAIDPTAGSGSMLLAGAMTFKHRHEKVVYRHLGATLGPSGELTSGHSKLFVLSGGSVARYGFGANISDVRLRFPRSAATKINRRLGTSLRPGPAGQLSATEQPHTVQVLSGTASVLPAAGPGSLASKLAAHCIDPDGGLTALGPATQPRGPGTALEFPVSTGTINPGGLDGVIQQRGGLQFANGGPGLPAGCPASNTVTVRLGNLSADLLNRSVLSDSTVSGSGSLVGAAQASLSLPIDIGDAWVNPDQLNLTLTTNGALIKLDATAAFLLNLVFPQPSPADPSMQYVDGDVFGTAAMMVRVR